MRVLILRQCALFLVAYLKREDSEPEGVLCTQLDCCDEIWTVLDQHPPLLRQFVAYLRHGATDGANARAMLEVRCLVLQIVAALVRSIANKPAGVAERQHQVLLAAGIYPTLLWLRRSWSTNVELCNASLTLEAALFDAQERFVGTLLPPNGGSKAPAWVVLESAGAKPDTAAADDAKKRKKSVRVLLSAVSHVAITSVPWSSRDTVGALKRAALRAGAPLLVAGEKARRVVSAATTASALQSDSSSENDDISDAEASRYALARAISGPTLSDNTKLGDVGIDSNTVLHLRRLPATVLVTIIIHGVRETVELSHDLLELKVVEEVRQACVALAPGPLAESCRIYAQASAEHGGVYELCERSRSLDSLPHGVPLQFKLPPRSLKVAFTDGTFVFVSVCEGLPIMQLLLKVGKKRSIAAERLKDFGVFVDDDAAAGGGYWLSDDVQSDGVAAKGTIAHLYEHADELQSVRFLPRARSAQIQLQFGGGDGFPADGVHAVELFFDVPVSASIQAICDAVGLTALAPNELTLVHKDKLVRRAKSTATDDDDSAATTSSKQDAPAAAAAVADTPLVAWMSLRSQGVEEGQTLLLQRPTTTMDPNAVDIWSPEESADTVQFAEEVDRVLGKKPIVAATLNYLVTYLTSDSAHDTNFADTFSIAFRTIASPETLMRKFVQRFNVPTTYDDNARFIVQMRVCIALKRLIDIYSECSPVPTLAPLEAIRDFVSSTVAQTRQCERIAPILLRQLEVAIERVHEVSRQMKKIDDEDAAAGGGTADDSQRAETKDSRRRNMSKQLGITVMSLAVEEVARAITVEDHALFCQIEPREYFDAAWTRKRRALAPNLRAFIDRFNMLSAWVSTTIVSAPLLRERVRVVERFIALMTALLELQNFSALMAVISGLNNSSVLRLKFTKQKLAKRSAMLLAQYESLMNMEGAFQAYRRAVNRCAPPLVPYVGVSLMDLTFIEEGNPDNVGPLINFAKRRMVVAVVQKLESFAARAMDLAVSKDVQLFFRNLTVLSDKECYALSLEIEPRGAVEKDLK
jgi:hypothetical protein